MAEHQARCPRCGVQFVYHGPSRPGRLCSDACRKAARAHAVAAFKARAPICSVEGCGHQTTGGRSLYCWKHYSRVRSHGDLRSKREISPPPVAVLDPQGYVLERAPGHPLANLSGSRAYQHRKVYYDAHGAGPFTCHWCAKPVTWADMHVDHLNAVRDDNALGNLVASCPSCNTRRGGWKSKVTERAKSRTRLTYLGEDLCLSEWAERTGVHRTTIARRLARGMVPEMALRP